MSSDATAWAWRQPVGHGQKLLLLALADTASARNTCEISVTRICAMTGLAVRTVRGYLRDLEQSNHLFEETRRDVRGRRLANCHHLNVNGLAPVPFGGLDTAWKDTP